MNKELVRWVREFRLEKYLDDYEVNEKLLEIEELLNDIDDESSFEQGRLDAINEIKNAINNM